MSVGDYGHELEFGSFITPANHDPAGVVALAEHSEIVGLDLVTFQDHPYQPSFLDSWTLLSFVAGRTERVKLAPNVLNLPLRKPGVIARAVASLDRLSRGRVELGLGAGAFWDAIVAVGAERLTPGLSVTALGEAMEIIRGLWVTGNAARLDVRGHHHEVAGAKSGRAPALAVEVGLGAYQPRVQRLVRPDADGWLPSLGYLKSVEELAASNARIDDAAAAAGRQPGEIRRLLNINGRFTEAETEGLLTGPPMQWAEQIADLALGFGMSTFILGSDDEKELATFGQEVAPAARELVASAGGCISTTAFPSRRRRSAPVPTTRSSLRVTM